MHVLLIRPGAIGDSLLTFPVMQALRVQHSDAHITFVSNAAVLPLAHACQLADATYDYSAPLWSQLFLPPDRYSQQVRTLLAHTDQVICWLRDDDGIIARGLRAVGIKHVTVAPGRPPAGERIHIVDYLLRTVGMGSSRWHASAGDPEGPPHSSSSTLAPTGTRMGVGDPEGAVAIHPGSGGAYKCWPVPFFITIIETLLQRSLPVLLLGGPADAARIQEIQQHVQRLTVSTAGNDAPLLFQTMFDAPLLTLAQRLQGCRGYLGNDSGMTHLAAMLGLRTVALFGPSDPDIWHPIGPHVHTLYEPALHHLSPDTVMHAIETFILL